MKLTCAVAMSHLFHFEIKQGTCAEPSGGRSRQDTFVQDEYRFPQPCLAPVLKGGGWVGGGKLLAAEHEWRCSRAGIRGGRGCI